MPPVSSTAIGYVAFNNKLQTLTITFRKRGRYTYYGISQEVFAAFLAASSKGRFFNFSIKDSYEYTRA
ncbi:KTSC domain-containing protein [Phyllobacterium sophorae]|uniref:KTSC domain-containing protein n=1 Tax=Phyllobacterium sophorae TaxID=1520277 RepID=A0A2P7BE00_9HYPH|nr:KTSC domain-containing protein [Phyllobacterium sophorae]